MFTVRTSIQLEAQVLKDLPETARGISVVDKVGEFIPLDLIFTDERGNQIWLGKFFKKNKPIILTLNYSDCRGSALPNWTIWWPICESLLDAIWVIVLRSLRLVSTQRREFTKARDTKAKYVGLLRDTKAEQAWHFLTGEQQQITKLANAVGFKYTYDKANNRYSHAAVTYFISPDGRICRYFVSLGLEPQQLKLAIAEAGKAN